MAKDELKRFLPRGLILDLEDRMAAATVKAFQIVRDHAGLDKKRGRELEGQARFRIMEHAFEDVCELYGGQQLGGGVIPNTDLKVFQPFARFGGTGPGVILGLAAMPERNKLPVKNRSRLAGVTLNFDLTPRLDFDGTGPKAGDIFVLFLVARDRERSGKLEEIAIGIIDSTYEQFLFYEPLDKFLADDADAPETGPLSPLPSGGTGVVRLKTMVKPFIPPEMPPTVEDEDGTA